MFNVAPRLTQSFLRLSSLSRLLPPIRSSKNVYPVTKVLCNTTARKMTSFTLPAPTPSQPETQVYIPPHLIFGENNTSLTRDNLLAFPAFQNWTRTLYYNLSLQHTDSKHPFHADPYLLRSIEVQSVDRFGAGKIGFVKLKADVSNNGGERLPGIAFLRGGTVGMLVVLTAEDDGTGSISKNPIPRSDKKEAYAVLTVQPRVPAGSLEMLELPAGMLDDSGSFAGAAAKEIEEELGLTIKKDQLIDLTALAASASDPDSSSDSSNEKEHLPSAVFPSAGGSDEHIALFLHTSCVPRSKLFKEWEGKLTGLREHGEKITLKLVHWSDLYKVGFRDGKVLSAWALVEGLQKDGLLQGFDKAKKGKTNL